MPNDIHISDVEFLHHRIDALAKRVDDIEEVKSQFAIMREFFVREFPKYFAGEAPLVFAPDGENQGGEILPDIHAIDLRTEEEKANGECYQLSDLVDMGNA